MATFSVTIGICAKKNNTTSFIYGRGGNVTISFGKKVYELTEQDETVIISGTEYAKYYIQWDDQIPSDSYATDFFKDGTNQKMQVYISLPGYGTTKCKEPYTDSADVFHADKYLKAPNNSSSSYRNVTYARNVSADNPTEWEPSVLNYDETLLPAIVEDDAPFNSIIIYDRFEKDFVSNGFGVLSDCISAEVTEELNGTYELEIEYPTNGMHVNDIQPLRILYCKPSRYANPQAFRIYSIEKNSDKKMTINAHHVSYDLDGWSTEVSNVNGAQNVMKLLREKAVDDSGNHRWRNFVDFRTDILDAYLVNENSKNLRSLLVDTMVSTFGGDLYFDNYKSYLMRDRGKNRGVYLSSGKNLSSVSYSIDYSETYDAVIGYYDKNEIYKCSAINRKQAFEPYSVAEKTKVYVYKDESNSYDYCYSNPDCTSIPDDNAFDESFDDYPDQTTYTEYWKTQFTDERIQELRDEGYNYIYVYAYLRITGLREYKKQTGRDIHHNPIYKYAYYLDVNSTRGKYPPSGTDKVTAFKVISGINDPRGTSPSINDISNDSYDCLLDYRSTDAFYIGENPAVYAEIAKTSIDNNGNPYSDIRYFPPFEETFINADKYYQYKDIINQLAITKVRTDEKYMNPSAIYAWCNRIRSISMDFGFEAYVKNTYKFHFLAESEDYLRDWDGVISFYHNPVDYGYTPLISDIFQSTVSLYADRIYMLNLTDEYDYIPTQEELSKRVAEYVADEYVFEPKMNVSVDLANIDESKPFLSKIMLGDTIQVVDTALGIDILEKCTSLTYDVLTNRNTSLEFGSLKDILYENKKRKKEQEEKLVAVDEKAEEATGSCSGTYDGNGGTYGTSQIQEINLGTNANSVLIFKIGSITGYVKWRFYKITDFFSYTYTDELEEITNSEVTDAIREKLNDGDDSSIASEYGFTEESDGTLTTTTLANMVVTTEMYSENGSDPVTISIPYGAGIKGDKLYVTGDWNKGISNRTMTYKYRGIMNGQEYAMFEEKLGSASTVYGYVVIS